MVKEIKVYTRPSCASCNMLKSWLSHKGLAYKEVNCDQDKEAGNEVQRLSGLFMVPLTLVTRHNGTQAVISGYNPMQLSKLFN
jgi:glutaredoxin